MAEDGSSCCIPVVDFKAFSIAHEEAPAVTDPAVQQMVRDVYSACSSLGVVYLTNHGIPQEEVLSFFDRVLAINVEGSVLCIMSYF